MAFVYLSYSSGVSCRSNTDGFSAILHVYNINRKCFIEQKIMKMSDNHAFWWKVYFRLSQRYWNNCSWTIRTKMVALCTSNTWRNDCSITMMKVDKYVLPRWFCSNTWLHPKHRISSSWLLPPLLLLRLLQQSFRIVIVRCKDWTVGTGAGGWTGTTDVGIFCGWFVSIFNKKIVVKVPCAYISLTTFEISFEAFTFDR